MKMWIARDPSGQLVLSENKMSWCGYYWCSPADDIIDLNDIRQFPDVTFDNSPQEVELINKKEFDSLLEVKEKYEEFLGIVAEMRCLQKEQDKWDDTYYCKSLHKRMVGLQKEVDQWSDLN